MTLVDKLAELPPGDRDLLCDLARQDSLRSRHKEIVAALTDLSEDDRLRVRMNAFAIARAAGMWPNQRTAEILIEHLRYDTAPITWDTGFYSDCVYVDPYVLLLHGATQYNGSSKTEESWRAQDNQDDYRWYQNRREQVQARHALRIENTMRRFTVLDFTASDIATSLGADIAKRLTTPGPFIVLKLGATVDGKVNGE